MPSTGNKIVVAVLLTVFFGVLFGGSICLWVVTGTVIDSTTASFCMISLLLVVGMLLRSSFHIFSLLHLPSCVVAGFLGLLLIQVWTAVDKDSPLLRGTTSGWQTMSSVAINMIFSSLFLGSRVPQNPKQLWEVCGLQYAYGQLLSWSQLLTGYSFGVLLAYWFDQNEAFGVCLSTGFEGSHGAVIGIQELLNLMGWPEGYDICMASATVGLCTGVVGGMLAINWYSTWGQHSKYCGWGRTPRDNLDTIPQPQQETTAGVADSQGLETTQPERTERKSLQRLSVNLGPDVQSRWWKVKLPTQLQPKNPIIPVEDQQHLGSTVINPDITSTVGFHLLVIVMGLFFGYALKGLLVSLDVPIKKHSDTFDVLFGAIPVFPLCMVGAILIQLIFQGFGYPHLVDSKICQQITSLLLDFLIVGSISNVKLATISAGIVPFVLLMVVGIVMQFLWLFFVAPWVFPEHWFERAIPEFGQATGVTPTGLLLVKLADPDQQTPAALCFAYKQLPATMTTTIGHTFCLIMFQYLGPWPPVGVAGAVLLLFILLLVWERQKAWKSL